jgi:hypothetical protein
MAVHLVTHYLEVHDIFIKKMYVYIKCVYPCITITYVLRVREFLWNYFIVYPIESLNQLKKKKTEFKYIA